jgi:Carbohydrate binding domain
MAHRLPMTPDALSSRSFTHPSLVLCLGLMCCLVFPAANAQNLVTNPGFEDGLAGWLVGFGPLTTTGVSPHSGATCGVAVNLGAYARAGGQSVLGKLQAGQTYTWSAWMRVASGTAPINMTLTQNDAAGGRNTTVLQTVTTAWTRYTSTFSLSVTGELSFLSLLFFNAGGMPITTWYLDDVSITNTSPPLVLTPTNQSVIVTWPSPATNYTLQTTTNLAAPINWLAVTNTAQSNAAAFSVTLPATNRSQFFRLRSQ